MTSITHVKALVIGSVADGNVDGTMQRLAKLCVTDDLLRQERREIARQAADEMRDMRLDRQWTVAEPIVTCRDAKDQMIAEGYRE